MSFDDLQLVSSPVVPDGKAFAAGGVVFMPEWAGPAHDAISAELVACTLGQRRRVELRVDFPGRLVAGVQRFLVELRGVFGGH